ncbi:MAG TPA: hypothetical protein VJ691_07735 [Vicinamibacterales bacterium]|nr:hypothetical protein [Vicinamibacterales bacterium]
MGKWITTALLCAASMVGAALIASQGFHPDPLPEETTLQEACDDIQDRDARADCLKLSN